MSRGLGQVISGWVERVTGSCQVYEVRRAQVRYAESVQLRTEHNYSYETEIAQNRETMSNGLPVRGRISSGSSGHRFKQDSPF